MFVMQHIYIIVIDDPRLLRTTTFVSQLTAIHRNKGQYCPVLYMDPLMYCIYRKCADEKYEIKNWSIKKRFNNVFRIII